MPNGAGERGREPVLPRGLRPPPVNPQVAREVFRERQLEESIEEALARARRGFAPPTVPLPIPPVTVGPPIVGGAAESVAGRFPPSVIRGVALGGAVASVITELLFEIGNELLDRESQRLIRDAEEELRILREAQARRARFGRVITIPEPVAEPVPQRAPQPVFTPSRPDIVELPDVIAEPLPLPAPDVPVTVPLPAPSTPVTIPAPTLPQPTTLPQPQTRPRSIPGPRTTPRVPLPQPLGLPLPRVFPFPLVSPRPALRPEFRPAAPPIPRLLPPPQPVSLTQPQPFALPSAQPQPQRRPRRPDCDPCESVKRRRRRKGKCREGFFVERPGSTDFTTWRTRDCVTGEVVQRK